MCTKFFDIKIFFKSKSSTKHNISEENLNDTKSSHTIFNKENCFQDHVFEKKIDEACVNIIEEDLTLNSFKTNNYDNSKSEKSDIVELKLFLNQNFQIIKVRKNKFLDSRFLAFISSIVEDEESPLYISLASRFKAKNLNELSNLIKWKRIKVKFYKYHLISIIIYFI